MTLDSMLIGLGEGARQAKNLLHKAYPIVIGAQIGAHIADKYFQAKTGFGFLDYFIKPYEISALADLARTMGGLPLLYADFKLNKWANEELEKAWKDKKLAQDGIYRYSRNPVYDGDRASAIGLTLVSPSILTATMAVAVYALTELAAKGEERKLKKEHGEEFLKFRERVPKFLLGNLLPRYWSVGTKSA